MPLSVIETLNKLSIYFLAIPLIFYLIYSIHNIKNIKHKIGFFASSLLISLLDPIFVILVFVLLFYLLLLYVEDKEQREIELAHFVGGVMDVLYTEGQGPTSLFVSS